MTPQTLRTGPDDDLGLPWGRLADGEVWHLRRGRDFHVETKALVRAAEVGANRMGKVACLAPHRVVRVNRYEEFVWVQFVDHDVPVGSPCPCGSRELIRTHPGYARCPSCAAHLKLSVPRRAERFAGDAPPEPEQEQEPEPDRRQVARAKAIARGRFRCKHDERFTLDEYTEVVVLASRERPDGRRRYARAVDPLGTPVLIWVEESDGASLVHRWPVPPFTDLIHLDRAVPAPDDAAQPSGNGAKREERGGRGHLRRFSRVKLVHQEDLPDRERLYVHGVDRRGTPSLIYVDYPLLDGARVSDPDDDEVEQHFAYRWPVAPFGPIIDLSPVALPRAGSPRRRAEKRVRTGVKKASRDTGRKRRGESGA